MMAKVYYEKDASLETLKNEIVAVIGFGSQGRAQALNARDSGLHVVVGLNPQGKSWKLAEKEGLEVLPVAEAAQKGTIIHLLIPDTVQPEVYKESIEPHLKEGKSLMFSHGFNIHFRQIVPPQEVDVFMIAPKGPGDLVRRTYLEGKGVPSLLAVEQNPSKRAKEKALAFAKAIGALRAGVLETTFAEETETDLFGEQVILCGGVSALIQAAFETLVEAGYQPESAYFECLHELKLIVDLIYEGGLKKMRHFCSETANYGDLTRGPRVIDEHVRQTMKQILKEIQTGTFAREWILENQVGRPVFNALMKKSQEHPIEKVGEELRKMMAWIDKRS